MRTAQRMTGAAAAVAAVALLVSGCGSSDDGGDGKDAGADKAKDTQRTADPTPSADEAGNGGGKAGLPGVWAAQAGGKKLVLTVVGDAASLVRDEKVCTGRVMDSGGKDGLVLKCPGGVGEDRTNGTVVSVAEKTLKVSWNGGATDTYGRVSKAPAKLPKSPGDLGELPDVPDMPDVPDGAKDKLKDITG
ncbi:hypothetical protein [Streptomyces cacaoi]|uniref:hypothetical protein n=1 Tax=Streptomyces cacaoi TaxID=1898 RepID=UPI00331E160E